MLLKPYRVLDLTGPLGYLCGRILGDLGADVIKIEPPGGDPMRSSPQQHLYFRVFNANKRGITLDMETAAGRTLFLKLVKKADFVLESFPPGTLDKLGLGYARLHEEKPSAILVSDRKSTRLNSSHIQKSRMPSSA